MTWVTQLVGSSDGGKKGSGKNVGAVGIGFPKGERTKTLEKWTESGKDVFCSLKISSDKDVRI